MRTKTLLLTAALAAAGAATSMAQVYSVNAVGYVNVTVPKGFSMIANPLKAADNTVAALMPSPPDGTTLYTFAAGSYTVNTFEFGAWDNASMVLTPGEGAFINNISGAAFTVTFVGEVMQGSLSNPVPAGFSIKSSQVPQSGQLDTDLAFPVAENDTVYQFNNAANSYSLHTYEFGAWDTAPVPAVGESFFIKTDTAKTWNRNFSVNQ